MLFRSHNLNELADAVMLLIERPEADLDDLMEIVKGPDFPTAAMIFDRAEIRNAYATGRGRVTMQARMELEESRAGRYQIVVTELPYQVNPDNLLLRIAELVGEGKLTGIADVRDDSSSRTGMRLIIELKRDAVAQVVLNQLYKHRSEEHTSELSHT